MGKIKKTASAKHEATLSPAISDFIKTGCSIDLPLLPSHLRSFPQQWPFPRGDLYHWIALLNRFDDLLQDIVERYGLIEGPQCQSFTRQFLLQDDKPKDNPTVHDLDALGLPADGDRELVESILDHTRLLMDNCGNRSLYASSSHLSALLNTTSISLLNTTLHLSLKLAQRYSTAQTRSKGPHLPNVNHTLLATHYMIDLEKIEALAKPFVKSLGSVEQSRSVAKNTERGVQVKAVTAPSFIALLQDQDDSGFKAEYGSPWITFKETSKDPESAPASPTPAPRRTAANQHTQLPNGSIESPSETRRHSDGADHGNTTSRLLEIPAERLSSVPVTDVMDEHIQKIPQSSRFELLCRVRNAVALSHSKDTREAIVATRVMAIANLTNIYPEQVLSKKLGDAEGDDTRRSRLPHQLCDLVHSPAKTADSVSKSLQSLSLAALEASANHQYRSIEVCNAIGASVNHGTLTYITRKMVTDLSHSHHDSESYQDAEWRDSLFGLLHSLPKANPRIGDGFVSAGLIEIFVEALRTRTAEAEYNYGRVLQFLDVFVYNTRDAFNALVNAGGLDAISELLDHEVAASLVTAKDSAGLPDKYRSSVTDYRIAFVQQQTLKALFRVIKNMMAINGGPFDRLLRNLIESSGLLRGIRTVIQNPTVYGSNVWSGAVDIFTTFINNEPTSYPAIAEAGLTTAFLSTITRSGPIPGAGTKEGINADILPTAEALTIIPQAFSAICLNDAGMQQVLDSGALRRFFQAILMPLHIKAMANAPSAETEDLGATLDELVRHHPRLKNEIVRGIIFISAVLASHSTRQRKGPITWRLWTKDEQGKPIPEAFDTEEDGILAYHALSQPLVANPTASQDPQSERSTEEDTRMTDASPTREVGNSSSILENEALAVEPPSAVEASQETPPLPSETTQGRDNPAATESTPATAPFWVKRQQVPSMVDFVDVISGILLGYFHSPSNCNTFVEYSGLERLVDVVAAPNHPPDFYRQPACQKLSKLMQIFVEQKPHLALPLLLNRLQYALDKAQPFLEHSPETSFFAALITNVELDSLDAQAPKRPHDDRAPANGQGTAAITALLMIRNICHVISRSIASSSHRNSPNPISLINLTDVYRGVAAGLAKVQSRCIWDYMKIQPLALHLANSTKQQPQPDSSKPAPSTDTKIKTVQESMLQLDVSIDGSNTASNNQQLCLARQNYTNIRQVLHHVPGEIAGFFASVGKSILIRRMPADQYQKQCVLSIATSIGHALIAVLKEPMQSTLEPRLKDYAIMLSLTLTAQALVDRRSDSQERQGPQLLTLVLWQFMKAGGLDQLIAAGQILFEHSQLSRYDDSEEFKNRGPEFALQGVQILFKLFMMFTTQKQIQESQQSAALVTRSEREIGREDYFQTGQFLVELRSYALRFVVPMWNTDTMSESRSTAVRHMCSILQHTLDGAGEAGALESRPRTHKVNHKTYKLKSNDSLTKLTQKDFAEDLAREALYRCNDNYSFAVEYCLLRKNNSALPSFPIPLSDLSSDSEPTPASENNTPAPLNNSGPRSVTLDAEQISSDLDADLRAEMDRVRQMMERPDEIPFPQAAALGSSHDAEIDGRPRPSAQPDDSEVPEETQTNSVITTKELNEQREEVRQDLVDRCLYVLDVCENLSFELADLIVAGTSKAANPKEMREDISETLIQSLISYQGADKSAESTRKIASCAHLLGVVLQSRDFYESARSVLQENFGNLVQFVAIDLEQKPGESMSWISNILLVLEKLIAEDAEPQQIEYTPPGNDSAKTEDKVAELKPSLVQLEDKQSLFRQICDILPRVGKDAALGLALTRMLVALTRERQLAVQAGEKRNLQRLFVMVKQLSGSLDDSLQSALMLVLRHIVEDDDTIRQIMRSDIQAFFEKQTRQVDTTTYTRQLYHLVLRQPEIFVEVTNELLIFPKIDRSQTPQVLMLKKDSPEMMLDAAVNEDVNAEGQAGSTASQNASTTAAPNATASEASGAGSNEQVQDVGMPDIKPSAEADETTDSKPADARLPTLDRTDSVTNFLLFELLNYKDVQDKEISQPSEKLASPPEDAEMANNETVAQSSNAPQPPQSPSQTAQPTTPGFKAEDHPIYVYRCFIMQCLTELLRSYNVCKTNFIHFSRKSDPQATTPSKPRSGVLNYLLASLIPVGTLQHATEDNLKKRVNTSHWATCVVQALCSRTSEHGHPKRRNLSDEDDEPDLAFIRRFVLEHALKVFKDAGSSSESLEATYSKFLCLAELFSRMLDGQTSSSQSRYGRGSGRDPPVSPSQKQIAKIMFEKNYIAALTNAVSEIDLNFPNASRAVKYILRPLRMLTHTGIELSLSSDISTPPDQAEDDEISSATSISMPDVLDDDREETPDLFRNSTLGMFEAGREEQLTSESSEDEEDEDEMYGEDYADDMEFDEDGREHDDDVISDEDEGMEDMGPMEGLPGDMPMEVEIELGDEDDEDDSSEDDDEGSLDEDEDNDDDDDGDEDDAHLEFMEELEEGEGDSEEEDPEGDDWQDEDDDPMTYEEGADLAEELDIGNPVAMNAGSPSDDDAESFHDHHAEVDILEEDADMDAYRDADGENDHEGAALEESDEDDEDDGEDEEDEYEDGFDFNAHIEIDGEGDGNPFVWGWNTGGRRHHHHHHHHLPILRTHHDRLMVPGFRSHRGPVMPNHQPEEGVNPLLNRARRRNAEGVDLAQDRRVGGPPPLDLPFPPGAIAELGRTMGIDGNPISYISNLFNALGHGRGLGGHQHRGGLSFMMSSGAEDLGPWFEVDNNPRHVHNNTDRDSPVGAVGWHAASTEERWQEDAHMLFDSHYAEKCSKVVNSILKLLSPPAVERERIRKLKHEEEMKKQDEERARLKAEREEREARETKEREEREAREAAEQAEAEAEAARLAAESNNDDATGPEGRNSVGEAMEGVERTSASGITAEETLDEPAERVFTTINGQQIDITNLGIDTAYLEALPEELRNEVITAQVAQRRTDVAASGQQPSEWDNEFLNALPDDIREEVLQQEAVDRRRRDREDRLRRAQAEGQSAQPEEIDPASFIASLDPMLRQQVLADSDEDILAQLPPDIAAEARALGGRHRQRAGQPTYFFGSGTGAERGGRAENPEQFGPRIFQARRFRPERKPIVQMVDKAGIATLLRLLFVPSTGNAQVSLNGILANAGGNRQSRAEIVNGLLSILQDGCVDASSIERCFAQLSSRAKQTNVSKTPQSARKQAPVSSLSSDVTPLMVVGQCLAALSHLTSALPHLPQLFLTEQENLLGPKTKSGRKGKGKDTKANRYPFIALLSLLNRDIIVNNAMTIEQLAGLLAVITQPLNSLLKKNDAQNDSTSRPAVGSDQTEQPQNADSETAQGQQTSNQDSSSQAAAAAEVNAPESAATAEAGPSNNEGDAVKEDKKKQRILKAPEVSPESLQPIVNILMARECSSKTFRDTLSTINNLSAIPGAKDTFASQLIQKARELGESIKHSLSALIKSLESAETEMQAQNLALADFSPNGSDQAIFNRILTALDYLFRPEANAQKEDTPLTGDDRAKDALADLYEDTSFINIWHQLGACLTATKRSENEYYFNVATMLLPLVEALMVVCKKVPLKDNKVLRSKATSPTTEQSEMRKVFFSFTNSHKKILNDLVRHSPKLMSGSFSVLIKNSSVLEFDNKRNFFNRRLHHRTSDMRHYPHPSLQLNVRREHVFLDSYKGLHYKKPEEIKYGKFNIRFHNEEGVDAGGVTREWFQVLSRQMFNADYALFVPVASDRTTFHPNGSSGINPEHLAFFKFIGRVIGKALYENRVLDCHFSRAVYKKILGQAVSMKDMETVDLDFSKNMEWMLNNDITDIITETFSMVQDNFGVVEVIDLIPNGRNIAVTNDNKEEYVRKNIEYRLTGSVQEQLDSFLQGFHDIVPPELISIFDEGELELLISGMPDVDVDDWKNNTEYHNYNAASPQIQWFWRAVRSFDKEERAKLLQFVTGTGKVPLNGFKELEGMNGFTRFTIHKDYGAKDRLPSSHTCFNQLDLPEYDDYESLRKNLYTAMTTGNEYFGYA